MMKAGLVAGLLVATCATALEPRQAVASPAQRPEPLHAGPVESGAAVATTGNAPLTDGRTPGGKNIPRADGASSDMVDGDDIFVTGRRPRGSVVGDIPPERTYRPNDIRAFGADDINDLLSVIGPQVF